MRMAESTDGYTGSDIQNICNQASKASVTRRIREDPECKAENWMITSDDFATAFRWVVGSLPCWVGSSPVSADGY